MSTQRHPRSGNTLILSLFATMGMLAVLALTVDVGYLQMVDAELQRTADSSALSGAWELYRQKELFKTSTDSAIGQAKDTSSLYARWNEVGTVTPQLTSDDLQVGYLANPTDGKAALDTSDPRRFNAVRIRVRRCQEVNGMVPLFFARALGYDNQALANQATAMYLNNFKGFRTPSNGANLQILPFALDEQSWDAMLDGSGNDAWRWDEDCQKVVAGADGFREINLYPQGTGSAGNRGTVDIGLPNNSTSAISRQITDGVSPQDLDDLGKPLELDETGKLSLNGDTGMSVGVKEELEAIKGQPRIVPIFTEVAHPGNNAEYTIVQFAGVRIMDVKLTGSMSSKRVLIQPATIQIKGGVPATTAQQSQYIYSPVWLVN